MLECGSLISRSHRGIETKGPFKMVRLGNSLLDRSSPSEEVPLQSFSDSPSLFDGTLLFPT
jgi:hypothetical protein